MRNGNSVQSMKTIYSLFVLLLVFLKANAYDVDHREPISQQTKEEANESFAVLLMIGLLVLCYLSAYLIKETHFSYLQEAGATILIGCLVGGIVRVVSTIDKLKSIVRMEPEFFFLFLLPPIIFEAGYNMSRRNFFRNIGAIASFALIGTTVASFITGFLLYLCSLAGFTRTSFGLIETLIFGSLISATDPVSVLAIFKALGVDVELHYLVFGESMLNDAVAIVLYRALCNFLLRPVSVGSVFIALGDFLLIFCGSMVIGIFIGLLSAMLFKFLNIHKYPIKETALLTIYAYGSYLLAEGLELSGIVSILFCGITMAHYTYLNLSKASQRLTVDMFQTLSSLSEMLVFVYLGLAVFSYSAEYDFGFIFCSILIIVIARAGNIFPICFVANRTRNEERKIPMKYQIFMCYAGLRGAMAFALALNLPPSVNKEKAEIMIAATLSVVLFTCILQGAATIPVLQKLKIPMAGFGKVSSEPEEDAVTMAMDNKHLFFRIDNLYLKPFFTRYRTTLADEASGRNGSEQFELRDVTRDTSSSHLILTNGDVEK